MQPESIIRWRSLSKLLSMNQSCGCVLCVWTSYFIQAQNMLWLEGTSLCFILNPASPLRLHSALRDRKYGRRALCRNFFLSGKPVLSFRGHVASRGRMFGTLNVKKILENKSASAWPYFKVYNSMGNVNCCINTAAFLKFVETTDTRPPCMTFQLPINILYILFLHKSDKL